MIYTPKLFPKPHLYIVWFILQYMFEVATLAAIHITTYPQIV